VGGVLTKEMQGVLLRAGEGESHPLIQEVGPDLGCVKAWTVASHAVMMSTCKQEA
jgi:hypothetical protein